MELKINIDPDKPLNSHFGISDHRAHELFIEMEKIQDSLDGQAPYKAEVFKQLISRCQTLEECVLLTHVYTNYINTEYNNP
jgi:hypothetical protein